MKSAPVSGQALRKRFHLTFFERAEQMSVNIPNLYVQQFATTVQLLLQQKGSKLRQSVMSGTHVGKQASPVDQIGSVDMVPVTGRFQPMGRVDAAVDRRWVFPSDFDLPQLLDSFDKLRLLIDPTSSYVQNAVYAAGRQIDKLIISAINGANYTGVNGTTSIAFPSGQQIAANFGASGNVGLTVSKLREARRILMAGNLDLDDPMNQLYAPIGAQQHDNLLAEAQVINMDYNDRPVLVEGKITRFLGINFIHTELNQVSGSSTLVPVYAKSGMYLGIWGDISTSISKRNDLQGEPYQAYAYLTAGATRLEEKKIVQIACN
jgi:hypothetical protein